VILLYQLQRCPWCAAARQALENVRQPYRTIEVPDERAQRTEVWELSGQPLVPVIVDGDRVVNDSRAIVRYLYDAYGDARQRARAREVAPGH
jgi:glutathione S-transferase